MVDGMLLVGYAAPSGLGGKRHVTQGVALGFVMAAPLGRREHIRVVNMVGG